MFRGLSKRALALLITTNDCGVGGTVSNQYVREAICLFSGPLKDVDFTVRPQLP
jgi:hypothetical protein